MIKDFRDPAVKNKRRISGWNLFQKDWYQNHGN